MASRTVTLFLDGSPTLAEFAVAIEGFSELLTGITRRLAPDAGVTWEVDDLEAESALTTARGIASEPEVVERLAEEFLLVGRQLVTSAPVPNYERAARKIVSVINGRVPTIKFETADDDVTISSSAAPTPLPVSQGTVDFGAVEGRIQTLSNRGGLRFTLYDLLYDKAVSCYLAEGEEQLLRDVWGRLTLVEGLVKRDPASGRPIAVRQVSRISLLEEGRPGAWRDAVGVLRGLTDGEPAEHTIRRLRDAE